jgi:hypothetical protein
MLERITGPRNVATHSPHMHVASLVPPLGTAGEELEGPGSGIEAVVAASELELDPSMLYRDATGDSCIEI